CADRLPSRMYPAPSIPKGKKSTRPSANRRKYIDDSFRRSGPLRSSGIHRRSIDEPVASDKPAHDVSRSRSPRSDRPDSLDENDGRRLPDPALRELVALSIHGSLVARTWLALALSPDWRWRLDGDATAWYPAMTLFR